jgi:hypothetical protein
MEGAPLGAPPPFFLSGRQTCRAVRAVRAEGSDAKRIARTLLLVRHGRVLLREQKRSGAASLFVFQTRSKQ